MIRCPPRWLLALCALGMTASALACRRDSGGLAGGHDGGAGPMRGGSTPGAQTDGGPSAGAGGGGAVGGVGGAGGGAGGGAADARPADSGAAGRGDAGPNDASAPDAALPALGVKAADVAVYLGQAAGVLAIASPAATVAFSWTLVRVPSGSTLTAGMTVAASAAASLAPDVAGEYLLRVAASAPGFTAASAEARMVAHDAPVFFVSNRVKGEESTFVMKVAGAVAAPARELACPQTGPKALADVKVLPSYGVDVWEAVPGQPSRVVYAAARLSDGSGARLLFAATSDSSCTAPPRAIAPALPNDRDYRQPSFSADGNRVAYLSFRMDTAIVATVGFDGSAGRAIGPFGQVSDSAPPRPQWKDDTQIGWVRANSADAWELVLARDTAGSVPMVAMTCAEARPKAFRFLPDGSILVARGGGLENLVIYRADPAKKCMLVRTLTRLTSPLGRVRDVALSPDGARAGFVYLPDDQVGRADVKDTYWGGLLATVPLDGSTSPQYVGALPMRVDFGPRWVAGGTRLVFTRRTGALQSAVVAPLSGAPIRELGSVDTTSEPQNIAATAGSGSACAFGRTRGGSAPTIALGALAWAAFAVRRRRRSVRSASV